MNNKILLVEDDINLGTILKEYLNVKGFVVTHAKDGLEGSLLFACNQYDLCILDVMMPKKDGFTLAKELKKHDEHMPIIFLTAKSILEDKIEGLKIGADDYITKPFSTEELLLRMHAILKRSGRSKFTGGYNQVYEIGKYKFDSFKRILIFGEKHRKLTSKENDLLQLLCLNKNMILERSTALQNIWKDDNYFNSRSMDVYITKLRNYLKNDSSIEIVNIHGQGFRLIAP
ncbi:MAG: response regulator transcription factor [Bacteroidetes bacterium]|nr:response regulator transcription factor [Bacteroidota bacterium]